MQPKFITFIQCTLDNKWKHAVRSEAGQEENMGIRNMTVFRLTETDAKINLIYEPEGGKATVQNRSIGRSWLEMECCIVMELM